MKILITGGAGFIGSHLAERLLKKENDVFIIDNFTTGKKENIPKNSNFIEGDISNINTCTTIFKEFEPDVVVHAAASYKDPNNWYTDTMTNVIGTVNIVKESLKCKVKRFIYFQTSLCYGLRPIEQPITLQHPINPTNSYSITKTAAERYISLSDLNFVSFRLANIYGPRNLSGPPPTFYSNLKKGKPCFVANTRRDFVFINDLLNIVEKAVNGIGNGFYHISTGRDYSIKEIYDAVANSLNLDIKAKEIERNSDDVFSILLDPTRTIKDFGILPDYSLEKGIEQAVEWYEQTEIKETYTHLRGFKNQNNI